MLPWQMATLCSFFRILNLPVLKKKFHSVYCGNFHMFSLLKCFLIYFDYFVRDFGTVVYGKDFFLLQVRYLLTSCKFLIVHVKLYENCLLRSQES